MCIQQEKVIAELQTHLDSTEGNPTYDYDKATLSYLVALNKIFETGLLSHQCVSDLDSSPMKNIETGFKFFEEWCDEALDSGCDICDEKQTVFLAWQVGTACDSKCVIVTQCACIVCTN